MIAGDGVASNLDMMGNDGDDKLYGSSSATGTQFIYGDTGTYGNENSYIVDTGDDRIQGGNMNSGSQYLVGGYGNDNILVGSDNTGTDLLIFGDLY